MNMQRFRRGLLRALFVLALLAPCGAWAEGKTFGDEQIDQMLAPIALHPDALLSQVLMASTYPLDVADAVKWSAAHPDQDGDDAVKAVEGEDWDPSVKSLVAFPQVLAMMGEKPEWVQDLGDAFLAQPEHMMDRIQYLRRKSEEAGYLKSDEQMSVTHEDAQPQADSSSTVEAEPAQTSQTVVVEQAPPQTIVIQQTNPQVVYVPAYNPTVVYGAWWWPRFRPWFWHPVGWGFGGAVMRGIGFGIGVGITNALWGGFNWGRGSVNVNVNRFNNVNVNNRINSRNRNANWNHNPDRRRGTPYRDDRSREKFSQRNEGGGRRDDHRGRDSQRDASRDRARQSLSDRGADPAKGRDKLRNDPQTRERAQQSANRDGARDRQGRDGARDRQAGAGDRSARQGGGADRSRQRADRQNNERSRAQASSQRGSRDNALRGAGSSRSTRQHANRGSSSRSSAARSSGSRGSRGGGGHRGGGGGRGGRR